MIMNFNLDIEKKDCACYISVKNCDKFVWTQVRSKKCSHFCVRFKKSEVMLFDACCSSVLIK